MDPFERAFQALTAHAPLRWQQRLHDDLLRGAVPRVCDIPTGIGKTSVIAIWLAALARQAETGRPSLPRRLVYVVNRRAIVDQASDEARSLLDTIEHALPGTDADAIRLALARLAVDPSKPFAVSTLRGHLADNRAWLEDPARAAIIVGTVDMIGSRLLFGGYGVSFRRHAMHAGLLGQDALLVIDEAHLVPAFSELLRAVEAEQLRSREPRPLRVMELSATQRDAGAGSFSLDEREAAEPLVARRIGAKKAVLIHEVPSSKQLVSRIAELALEHGGARSRVVTFVRRPDDALAIARELAKRLGGAARICLLTGTLRGYERDRLAESPIFRAFAPSDDRPAPGESAFLVATSAGEVGVNLDADHAVCDLTTLDSMIQRLGRVNRFGRADDRWISSVDVVAAVDPSDDSPFERARVATMQALRTLPELDDGRLDASPRALRLLRDRVEAFAPVPRLVPATDVLFDAWSMTTLSDDRELRPDRDCWLHGVSAEPPETEVAWRAELDLNDFAKLSSAALDELYRHHRVLPGERMRTRTAVLADALSERLAARPELGGLVGVLLRAGSRAEIVPLTSLRQENKRQRDGVVARLMGTTLVLPTRFGALRDGMLDPKADAPEPCSSLDVADIEDLAPGAPVRARVLQGPGAPPLAIGVTEVAPDMRPRATIVLSRSGDDDPATLLVVLSAPEDVDAALEDESIARVPQRLPDHLAWTRRAAAALVARVGLDGPVASAIVRAAFEHDRGKARRVWQLAIGNTDWKADPLAKSDRKRFDFALAGGYRHELGSLHDVEAELDEEERDLILHLMATHHGRGRPHFAENEWDPTRSFEDNASVVDAQARRFARLQRRFGRWGLAWLEAMLQAADVIATVRAERTPGARP